jgi:hypothetical protein
MLHGGFPFALSSFARTVAHAAREGERFAQLGA